ncbi:MAG: alpha/beta hydrolase [Candidatus Nanopelagicales bacterium]|nr:alpha/beta hydrolase [Candidatus Nanopelagicales bacterium]
MSVPVVLVHGLGSSFAHNWGVSGWDDILQSEGFEVVAHELPGHGAAAEAPGGEDEAIARLVELVTQIGPVAAVGFSAGARLVLRAALARPEAFTRIALLGIGDGMWSHRQSDSEEIVMADLVLQLLETAGNDRASVERYVRGFTEMPDLGTLAKVTVPALVVIGDRDMVGPADQLTAALPNARMVVLKGVDHYATTSNFTCQDEVLRFLSE